MAIASVVCSAGAVMFFGVPSLVGVILGFVARGQIRRSGGMQTGSGLALAGIIVGLAVIAVGALFVIVPWALSTAHA